MSEFDVFFMWSTNFFVLFTMALIVSPFGKIRIGGKEAKSLALAATVYNWGIHGWAIYGVAGLSLAFFSYNKGLPLSIRSVFLMWFD
jgi:BCCT family betaine/carnitine transporter